MFTRRVPPSFGVPAPVFGNLANEMNRLFEAVSPAVTQGWRQPASFPALNVWEDADTVFVEAELPGFSMSDLDLTMLGDELTINGGRQELPPPEGVVFHRRERPAGIGGRFSRSIRLAIPVDADKVSASLENGVLTVTLPKSAAAKPRTIEVKTSRPATGG